MKTFGSKLMNIVLGLIGALAIALVVLGVVRLFGPPWPVDDTDLSERVRSGMRPLTDYSTGCQYLTTIRGGITPRLDPAGRPICVGPLK